MTDSYSYSSSSTSSSSSSNTPLMADPLHVSLGLFICLILFVFYLLLPRGVRKQYFGAYPKRHAWSARMRNYSGSIASTANSNVGANKQQRGNMMGAQATSHHGHHHYDDEENLVQFDSSNNNNSNAPTSLQQDEIVISAAMQQLRDPGVLIVAHGSRGKPKTVRLLLTESTISWRTETRKPNAGKSVAKLGKLHQVPLAHIMYVDVGKQTTALRRVENASVPESLCFSLLTKEGSLDLEANSPRERDALVSCFSLVLDEVHAQNWRDIYRGPSSDMPSSFDEMDHK